MKVGVFKMKKIIFLVVLLIILSVGCGQRIVQPQPPIPSWVKGAEVYRQGGVVYGIGVSQGEKVQRKAIEQAIEQAKERIRSFLKIEEDLPSLHLITSWQDPITGAFYIRACCHDIGEKD